MTSISLDTQLEIDNYGSTYIDTIVTILDSSGTATSSQVLPMGTRQFPNSVQATQYVNNYYHNNPAKLTSSQLSLIVRNVALMDQINAYISSLNGYQIKNLKVFIAATQASTLTDSIKAFVQGSVAQSYFTQRAYISSADAVGWIQKSYIVGNYSTLSGIQKNYIHGFNSAGASQSALLIASRSQIKSLRAFVGA